jgi:hypothetical protein
LEKVQLKNLKNAPRRAVINYFAEVLVAAD